MATVLVRLDPAARPGPRLPATARCLYQQYRAPLRYESARLLGFERGHVMARRVVVLIIDSQPVLSVTSYLPVELVEQEADKDWHQVELGRLALLGHAITLAGPRRIQSRLPTTTERETLGIPADAEIPVTLYVRAYHVHEMQLEPLRAGLIVRARSDRVYWSFDHGCSALLLEPGSGFA